MDKKVRARLQNKTAPRRILVGILVASVACFAIYRIHANWREQSIAEDWERRVVTSLGFTPGVIVNGQDPPGFVVTMIEPSQSKALRVKPGTKFTIRSTVTLVDQGEAPNAVPPTFVRYYIHGPRGFKKTLLATPELRRGQDYIYHSDALAPKKPGKYSISVEVQYEIMDIRAGGKLASRKKDARSYKRAEIDVE